MRLICPNCDAQYNVADDAIPEGGRDVQCSNCAHTWLQTDKPAVAGRTTSRVLSRPIFSSTDEAETATKSEYDKPAAENSVKQQPDRRPVDANVAAILREEAAREHTVSDSGAWEPPAEKEAQRAQDKNVEETRKRIAQMTEDAGGKRSGTGGAEALAVAAAANPRAVPDIKEINAALRARAEANDDSGMNEEEKQQAIRRSGFRRGFFIVLIIMAIVILPYIFAGQIVDAMPQTRPVIEPYVAVIDQLRLSLEALVDAVASSIQNLTSGSDDSAVQN